MSKSDTSSDLLTRTLLLGVMSGMRSMSAPALISRRAVQNPHAFKGTLFAPLAQKEASSLAGLAALGEIVIDKLPILPKRTALLPLLGRAMLGGFAGAAAYTEPKRSASEGAIIGALAAVASSYVSYFIRRGVGKLLHLPDLPVAILEDVGVAGIGRAVMQTYE